MENKKGITWWLEVIRALLAALAGVLGGAVT